MNGPEALSLGGGQILLRGEAVVAVSRILTGAVNAAQRRDGLQPPPQLIDLQQLIAAEADQVAAHGRMFAKPQPVMPPSSPDISDMITTREVAVILDLSPRQVRRLTQQLGGRQVAGRWLFPRSAVVAAAPERPAA